jgi:hypothetical protein
MTRMLKSGILSEGELTVSEEGVPQDSICSPILANIFAHYVIDEWFEEVVKEHCTGNVALFRYADDMVICCENERDARRIMEALAGRLQKYGLQLNQEKTRILTFSRKGYQKGENQGTFDFLGFTFYMGRSRKGNVIPKLKSSGKRLAGKLKRVSQWAQMVRNQYPLREIWRMFCIKLKGHIRYYGVSFNIGHVLQFLWSSVRLLFKWLNRRSQRKSFTWERFNRFIEANPLPIVKIYHSLF